MKVKYEARGYSTFVWNPLLDAFVDKNDGLTFY
jgi:hypothetical protein